MQWPLPVTVGPEFGPGCRLTLRFLPVTKPLQREGPGRARDSEPLSSSQPRGMEPVAWPCWDGICA